MRARAALVFIFVLGSGFIGRVHSALACSVCGCDPTAGTLGLDRPFANTLRLALENRVLTKESGAGDAAESEREDRALLRLQYAVLPNLIVQGELPVYAFKRHLNSLGVQDDNGHGLGDVGVAARYEFLRAGNFVTGHVLAVTAGLKFPTGDNNRHLPGMDPDEHLQLGTGSWDTTFGLSYIFGSLPWTVFANASARVNGTNGRGFQYGNALFGTLGARRSFLQSERLLLSLEAQVRSAGKDRLAGGGYDEDSGGQVYYGTASAAYALTDFLLVRGTLQVPVVTALNGTQGEHAVVYLQLAYDFAL